MKIILKSIKQDIFELDLTDLKISIKDLKSLIESKYGYDKSRIKLIKNTTVLEDSKFLLDYSESSDETLSLVIANLKKKTIQDSEDNQNESINVCEENLSSNNQEKLYKAEIKAENAIQYVASIMKILCLRSPGKEKEFFNNLEEDNPQIMHLIRKNQTLFKSLLYSPKNENDERVFEEFYKGELKDTNSIGNSNNTENILNSKDEENISNLTGLGFIKEDVTEAYFKNGKNFESTLNYLLTKP